MQAGIDRPRFLKAFTRLCLAFDKPYSRDLEAIYWDAVSDLSIEAVERIFSRAETAFEFFPRPKQVRELAMGTGKDRAALAWDKVTGAVSSHGSYRSVQFDDPAIHLAIESMGGWVSFGTRESKDEDGSPEDWARKEFERCYLVGVGTLDRVGVARAKPPLTLAGTYELQGQAADVRQIGDPAQIAAWTGDLARPALDGTRQTKKLEGLLAPIAEKGQDKR